MSGIDTVLGVLESNGYKRLPKPLTVAGTQFEFEAAVSGTDKSQDLVIVASRELPPRRLLRLVAVLARSLDVMNSRRPVTVLILGSIGPTEKAELERHARILVLGTNEPTIEEVRHAASVLLPLSLPSVSVAGRDPISEVFEILSVQLTDEHVALIRSAAGGAAHVETALRKYVNAAVRDGADVDE
ncbi:hypothetical protein [Nocardioides sp. WS12]|uniref:hypothetical protein n=1 Tax=Nocardioides sp. WS12 TaxID=2486272 RepID=UPI0015F8A46E|nr:hypothetical protein [Nocardioides sp. WS12]